MDMRIQGVIEIHEKDKADKKIQSSLTVEQVEILIKGYRAILKAAEVRLCQK